MNAYMKNHKEHEEEGLQEQTERTHHPIQRKDSNALPITIILAGVLIAGSLIYKDWSDENQTQFKVNQNGQTTDRPSALEGSVIPQVGVALPVRWGDLGKRLVSTGTIDSDKLKALYEQRGLFTDEYKTLLLGESDGNLKITPGNAGYILNLLWALGLGSDNPILKKGEMADPRYGGTQDFASTGGWIVAKGSPMDHYSRHSFFQLTAEQQALVDRISRGIYRPCCNNSTHFPDCNHGMAMLGLLELMASQGVSEQDMWRAALAVNSYWFPDTYITIATYMKNKGIEWKNVDPQKMLGSDYSSASGSAKISAQVAPSPIRRSGSGCGVGAGVAPVQPASVPRQQVGCGV